LIIIPKQYHLVGSKKKQTARSISIVEEHAIIGIVGYFFGVMISCCYLFWLL
jgi:hypothetical protein